MKIAKMMCPVCHLPIKVAHTYKYTDVRVRTYSCPKCNIVVRTVQKKDETEQVRDFWPTRPYVKLKEVLS